MPDQKPVVGLLHPGEMGAALGAALVERGVRVRWASDGRSVESRRRAEVAELDDAGLLNDLLQSVDVVFCTCPPHAALEVASRVAATGFSGLYVDANAVAPSTALAIQRVLEEAGSGFVDGDLIGGPPRSGGRTRLYLSGPAAGAVTDLLAGSDRVEAIKLDGPITAASALKMAYAAWTKGSAALLLAICAVARAAGVEEALRREWGRSQPDLIERVEAARRVVPKAWRFAGEMDEIARCFGECELPEGFGEASAAVYRALNRFKGADVELDSIIEVLLRSQQERSSDRHS